MAAYHPMEIDCDELNQLLFGFSRPIEKMVLYMLTTIAEKRYIIMHGPEIIKRPSYIALFFIIKRINKTNKISPTIQ
jgi:hypothetical protein